MRSFDRDYSAMIINIIMPDEFMPPPQHLYSKGKLPKPMFCAEKIAVCFIVNLQ